MRPEFVPLLRAVVSSRVVVEPLLLVVLLPLVDPLLDDVRPEFDPVFDDLVLGVTLLPLLVDDPFAGVHGTWDELDGAGVVCPVCGEVVELCAAA
jgi:hypothetical protein